MNKPPQFRKLLVRSPNWLGDAVMATPALMRLHLALPDTQIWILTPEKLKDLFLGHPAVRGVLGFRKEEGLWRLARRIRQEAFDAAFLLPNSHRTALEVFLARVPARFGLSRPFRGTFLTRTAQPRPGRVHMRKRDDEEVKRLVAGPPKSRPEFSPDAHQVHDYLQLAADLFGSNPSPLPPVLTVSEEEKKNALTKFCIPAGAPLLAMNPGAQYGPAKRWPAQSFLEAALAVSNQKPAQWILLGTNEDAALCESLAKDLKGTHPGSARSLAGKTSLRELMALLAACDVVLTNDSGPMHLACALGRPLVVIFGSTSPELTGPFPPDNDSQIVLRSTVGCSPCFRRECPVGLQCMKEIRPETAAKAILRLLPETRRPVSELKGS